MNKNQIKQNNKIDNGINNNELIDRLINKRYKILEFINSGAFASVFKAIDLDASFLNKEDVFVAVKIMLKGKRKNTQEINDRLNYEVNTFAKLSFSKNVINMKDVFEWDKYYVIVMELVEGIDLSKKFSVYNNILSTNEFIYYFEQIAKGLKEIHDSNIIHRDVKPANILITKHQKAKISDFGISKIKSIINETNEDNFSPGTPRYTAPEQFINFESKKNIYSYESDIYSVGVMMYEFITGTTLFLNTNYGNSNIKEREKENFKKHLVKEVLRPRYINPGIPQSIENIIMHCLAKEVKNRYKNFDELLSDLQKAKLELDVKKDFPEMNWEADKISNMKLNYNIRYKNFIEEFPYRFTIPTLLIVFVSLILFIVVIIFNQ
ncbi:serine/threonine-protein kinase [Mycoplasma yeatsii]|uniref:Serine/threonine protein kinase n=1 Tax=Mycoplasma yeatsii TaxID=51365 RepID=A0ABU0NDF1_9MOLU|nr:serine/threonine-protein kinase [Mycoplasma yeatsii]MDQ0567472.1 serine/threonine protein kinase [Mycoplasma yeatsii]